MPDILIRGMEMPKTCSQCGFRCYDPHRQPSDGLGKGTNVCWFTQEEIWNTQRGERCPLIELPPHGDLIDRRELQNTVMQVVTKFPTNNIAAIEHLDLVNALLRGAAVVVPAERSEG